MLLKNLALRNREIIMRWAEKVNVYAICLLALGLLAIRALTHAPFFDETMHVRFVWLLSRGLKPESDYFCQYPALAYICASLW